MLDISGVYDSTGNTGLTGFTTAVTGEKHLVNSTGINPLDSQKAVTIAYGAFAIAVADAVKDLQLQNGDVWDTQNLPEWKPTGTSVAISTPVFRTQLRSQNGRLLNYAQVAAAKLIGYTIDHYPSGTGGSVAPVSGTYTPTMLAPYNVTMAAQTAGSWAASKLWAPAILPPTAKYAILGFYLSAVTVTTGIGLIGFEHNDFGKLRPGIPAVDWTTTSLTTANFSGDSFLLGYQGYQFVRMSEITRQPQCPVFNVNSVTGTGLNIFCATLNADSPTLTLNLMPV